MLFKKELSSLSLGKQTTICSIGSLIMLGCQWIIIVLLVRISGYEDAGVFSLAMSVANVFSTLANYGLRNYQVADVEVRYMPFQYIVARLVSSAGAMLLCCCYLFLRNDSLYISGAIIAYLLYNLSFIISDILMGNLQRDGMLQCTGFSNSARGIVSFFLFFGVWFFTKKLLSSMLAMACGSIIVFLFHDIPLYKMFYRNNRQSQGKRQFPTRRLFLECFFIMISTLAPIIVTAIPRIEMQNQLGEKMVGIFSSIYTPTVILNTLIPSVLIAFVPHISRLWIERDIKRLKKEICKSYGLILAITVVAVIFAMLLGKVFLSLMYGEEILLYFNILYYAIIAISLNCFCVCGNNILIAFNRKWQIAFSSIVSVIVVSVFSKLFIETLGIYGVAYIQILSYFVQTILQLIIIILFVVKRKC